MSNPLTPERRISLRAHAEAAVRHPDPGAVFALRRNWAAAVLDLLAALEAAEAERDAFQNALQRAADLAAALSNLPSLPSRNHPEWSRADERERAKDSGRLIAEVARAALPKPPRPTRAEIEAVAGRYRDALPSVEEHLADKHAEMGGPRLRAVLEAAEARAAELLDLVADLAGQACGGEDGHLDSMALRDYAAALRVLAEAGRVEIVSEYGRRVIARWKEPEGAEDEH